MAGIGINAVDLESMVTLSPIVTTTVENANKELEDLLVYNLATQKSAGVENILSSTDTETDSYYDESTGSEFYSKEIGSQLRGVFDIYTSKGLNDGNFAIGAKYLEPVNVYDDSLNLVIGSVYDKTIQIVQPTNSIYEANLEFITNVNEDAVYTQNEDFTGYFDYNNSNQNLLRALNSQFNTTDNSRPMYVQEDVSFNQNFAMGNHTDVYYTVDTTTGGLIENELSAENKLGYNGYQFSNNMGDFDVNRDAGVYRIKQLDDAPLVKVQVDSRLDIPESENEYYDNLSLPLFNSTIDSKLPVNPLSNENFLTIFDLSSEIIMPNYQVSVLIENTQNSGYALSSDMLVRDNGIFSLDDGSLIDNYAYMRDYVTGSHDVSFNNATLTLETLTNGSQSNIDDCFTLSTGREILPSNLNQDGQILLNTRSPLTRVDVLTNDNEDLRARIVYNNEDGSRVGISSELKTNNYVRYLNQLVLKNPIYDTGFAYDNGASINFVHNNSIINSYFSEGDISFTNVTNPDPTKLEIFKVMSYQKLRSINGFVDTSSNVEVPGFIPFVKINNLLTIPNQTESLNRLHLFANLKNINELTIYNDASASGWTTENYTRTNLINTPTDFVSCSTTSAFPQTGTAWPSYKDTIKLIKGTVTSIPYNITFNITNEQYASSLVQNYSAIVYWTVDASDHELRIFGDAVQNTTNCVFNDPVYEELNVDDYMIMPNLSPNPFANKINVKLLRVTRTNTLQFRFETLLTPYDNLTLVTPLFDLTTTSYTVSYNSLEGDEETTYNSDYLEYFLLSPATSLDPATDFNSIVSNYVFNNEGDALSFSGSLTSNDLKEFNVHLSAVNNDETYTTVTEVYKISAFYDLPIIMEFHQEYEAENITGDAEVYLRPNAFYTELNGQLGYVVHLVTDTSSSVFKVEYFQSDLNNLLNTADLSEGQTLNVDNVFSNITNWDLTSYIVGVSFEELNNSTAVLSITKVSDSSVTAEIRVNDFKFLNTQLLITRANRDVYRVVKWIGDNVESNTMTENLLAVDYTYNSVENTFTIDTGVYVENVSGNLGFGIDSAIGNTFDFELLQDTIAVNLVGNADTNLQPISDFTYQYVVGEGEYYSRSLTVDRYRGYYGTNSVDQSYRLKRDQLVASFVVKNLGNVAEQSFNVNGRDGFTVNNLMHNSSSVGDIGLGLNFEYSMLGEEDALLYPIYTMGDNVTFSIVNPNLTSFTPVEEIYTLKDYSLHTFLGSNFASTGGPLKFNSSRLKLNNNYYDNNFARYSITLDSGTTEVRFIQDYLGDPTEISNSDWNNQDLLASGNYVDLVDGGLTLNSFNISRLENTQVMPSTSYLVLVPPYLKFVQRGSFVQETDLPYDPATNAEDNTVVSYLPVSTTKEYFPFATRSFTYFGGSTATVTFDPAHTNNVEIYNNNNRSDEYTSIYSENPNSDIRSFYVAGNYYVINLRLGAKSHFDSALITNIFNDVANNLRYSEILTLVSDISSNSGVIVSYRQPLVGFFGGQVSATQVYGSNSDVSPNITFQVDNFFLTGLNSGKLNLPILTGVSINLYTRKLFVDGSGNASINIYKYEPLANIFETQTIENPQVNAVFFNNRSFKTLQVPAITIQQTTIPNWSNLLNQINPELIPASWTEDASFSDNVFVNVTHLNIDSIPDIQPLLFGCQTNGTLKATLINKQSILQVLNKIGMPIMEIDANGSIQTPSVATSEIVLKPVVDTTINSSFTNYTLLSILGYLN